MGASRTTIFKPNAASASTSFPSAPNTWYGPIAISARRPANDPAIDEAHPSRLNDPRHVLRCLGIDGVEVDIDWLARCACEGRRKTVGQRDRVCRRHNRQKEVHSDQLLFSDGFHTGFRGAFGARGAATRKIGANLKSFSDKARCRRNARAGLRHDGNDRRS